MQKWLIPQRWWLTFCLCLVVLTFDRVTESAEPIRWRSVDRSAARQSRDDIRNVLAQAAIAPTARHLVVQFDTPLAPTERRDLASLGLSLLGYLGDNAYFASIAPAQPDVRAIAEDPSLIRAQWIERDWKLHPALSVGPVPSWAIREAKSNDPVIAAYVVFHRDVPLVPDATRVAERHGASVRSVLRSVRALVVELPQSSIANLADEDSVQWIEPPLPRLEAVNDVTRLITGAEVVQQPPYDLDGTGVTVLVYDAGNAEEMHPDFGNRLTARDAAGVSGHATHVSCTVGGDGAESGGQYRGMAPNVTIESYGADCCPPGFLYTNPLDMEEDYGEAIDRYGADISNNSIGTNVCGNGLDCEWTGDYGVTAQLIDAIVRGSLGQHFRIIWALGNERGCSRCRNEGVHTPEGYHSTAPPGCAKNHITVGALTDNDTVTSFTSWGPTDDGRIKPDISAPGQGVVSCAVPEGYATLSGTSMAAPAATGISALLLQDYRTQFPRRGEPRNSTLKVLLAHTAVEVGNPGPDYQTGYGSVRIQQAIDFMRSNNGLNFLEAEAAGDAIFAVALRVAPEDTELKVTLAWDDFPGTPNVSPALVNDLDLRVFDPLGARHFPWTLDPDDPGAMAVRTRADHVNNIEQVLVESPLPGLWRVEVFGFNVPEGPQIYSLAASPQLVFDCNSNDIPDDEEIQSDPARDCSSNGILDECEPDCDGDGTVDSCEIFGGFDTDCDTDGVPDGCQTFADCDANGTFDPCDISLGGAPDCNRNWIPDACIEQEEDCNGNLVPDACDLDFGTSKDCDRDDFPDECELIDCNGNEVLDSCDIAAGTSVDCNENQVPDECEPDRTIIVDDDATLDPLHGDPTESDPDEDGSVLHPFDAIQEAIDSAACGDTILLRDGVYRGGGNTDLDTRGKSILVKSENGPSHCVIDGEGESRGFHFHAGEDPSTRLEGVTIQNASADDGAAIRCEASSPTIMNCLLRDGWAQEGGAGILCDRRSDPTIVQCVFANNSGGSGSGVYCLQRSNPLIEGCLFVGNVADRGAAILTRSDSAPKIVNSRFVGNWSHAGGAISFNSNTRPSVINSLFVGNEALGPGGAIYAGSGAAPMITNSTFWRNRAQRGAALFCMSACHATVRNSILWGDQAVDGPEIVSSRVGAAVTVRRCNVEGGEAAIVAEEGALLHWNSTNIEADPLYVDPTGVDGLPGTVDDNLRLSLASPCVNTGSNGLVPEGITTDLDGAARIAAGTVDMGAYERNDFCGNGICDPNEDRCTCPDDCGGLPSEDTGLVCRDGIDNDCNGVADCADPGCAAGPACVCLAASAPAADALGPKNRYVSFIDGNPGWLSAMRVTFRTLPPPFDVADGTMMWVGPPRVICENAGQSSPAPDGCGPAPGLESRTATVASLQCQPHYDDWSRYGSVHVHDDFIVPGATYELQAIGLPCDASAENAYSARLSVGTSRWGDVVSNCLTAPCGPPNGSIEVITDVVSVLSKFANLDGAPIKARADLEPGGVDAVVQISDVISALSAFEGSSFPFHPAIEPPSCPTGDRAVP